MNHLVSVGLIPNPNELHCCKCDHIGEDRRHEYHHSEGYGIDSQEIVEALCTRCHAGTDGSGKNRKRDLKGKFCG